MQSTFKRRGRRRQADVNARLRMVWLWLAGLSVREVSCHMRVSVTTVYRWVRRWQEEGTVKTRSYRRASCFNLSKFKQSNSAMYREADTLWCSYEGTWNTKKIPLDVTGSMAIQGKQPYSFKLCF